MVPPVDAELKVQTGSRRCAQKASEPAGGPHQEDTVDTMVFKSSDVVLVYFQNVDFNYATKVH